MRKVWHLWLLGWMLLVHLPVANAVEPLRVGVYQNSPQVYMDARGVANGFYIDLLEYIAVKEGWVLTMVPGTWAQGLERVTRGEIDLLPAIAYLGDGSRQVEYSQETVLANWGQLYVTQGRIRSLLDLEDKKIIGMEADIYTQQFQETLKRFGIRYQFESVEEYEQALAALAAGRGDAAIVSKTFGLSNEHRFPILRSAIVCCPAELRFAAPVGGGAGPLAIIDRHLKALKADKGSFYYQALSRWFGVVEREVVPGWVPWGFAGCGVVAVTFLSGLVLVRRRLRLQYAALRNEIRVREETDAQLKRSNRELELRARELRDARDVAEAANRAKSQFLTNMGHEIRTPMNAIQGMTEMALRAEQLPKARELLGHVLIASRSLMRIINSILEFTKLDRGQETPEIAAFDMMRDLFSPVMEFASSAAVTRDLEIAFEPEPGVPREVLGDRDKLERVLICLVDNALKFTAQGSVTLRVALRERHGELNRLEFSVRDTGVGVPPDQWVRIFDPFVQGDASLTRRYGGAGMGLAVSKRLVELMGGRIWVESIVNQGSVFYFTLLCKIAPGNGSASCEALRMTSAFGPLAGDGGGGAPGAGKVLDPVCLGQLQQDQLCRLAHYLDQGDSLGAEVVLRELKGVFEGTDKAREFNRIATLLDEFELQAARHALVQIANSMDVILNRRATDATKDPAGG
ncbi:MAG: transporter substrate-binding domain-containing protein [Magnetococcales bacterium]|nr:transporter substrate-binding domain-containing protein [Magnetococcales bacterium]